MNAGFLRNETYYKFTGHERDAESGLDHTLNRQYSSNTGRWLSADPSRGKPSDPQSWNRYPYANNTPCSAYDPDGGIVSLISQPPPPPPPFLVNPLEFESGINYGTGLVIAPPAPYPNDQAAADGLLGFAMLAAVDALGKGPCSKLFNTNGPGVNPAKVLKNMVWNGWEIGNKDYRTISFSSDPNVVRHDAVTEENHDKAVIENNSVVYTEVNTTINTNNWLNMGDINRQRLLIHELGHVFNRLAGAGGSAFEEDADTLVSGYNRSPLKRLRGTNKSE